MLTRDTTVEKLSDVSSYGRPLCNRRFSIFRWEISLCSLFVLSLAVHVLQWETQRCVCTLLVYTATCRYPYLLTNTESLNLPVVDCCLQLDIHVNVQVIGSHCLALLAAEGYSIQCATCPPALEVHLIHNDLECAWGKRWATVRVSFVHLPHI